MKKILEVFLVTSLQSLVSSVQETNCFKLVTGDKRLETCSSLGALNG